jgi:hypothetical protein
MRTIWHQCGPGFHAEDGCHKKTLDTGSELGVGTAGKILFISVGRGNIFMGLHGLSEREPRRVIWWTMGGLIADRLQ